MEVTKYQVLDKYNNHHGTFEDEKTALELSDAMNDQYPGKGYYVEPKIVDVA